MHPSQQNSIQKMQRRQCRASNWREFGSWITTKDWSDVYSCLSCSSKFDLFYQQLSSAIDIFFPWKTVKVHVYDKPWITVKLKSMIKKRQAAFIKHGKDSLIYKFWRNRVQHAMKIAKRAYYSNKIDGLANTNSKKWWKDIKSLTGQLSLSKQQWYHQFLNDVITSPAELATQVNNFFTGLTEQFDPLTPVQTPPNVIPSHLFVSLQEVLSDLRNLSTHTAIGPDGISNKLLKEFAPECARYLQSIT